jgi:Fur family ferric uptake transcriptional regulator
LHVIREAGEGARAFRRALDHRNYYGAMDREAASPPLPVREWDEQLRARGYRVTPQRQLVLEAVARLDHATPEEIGAQVQQTARGVNISTIYRTLELLEQIGMVTHTHLGHGAPIYHLASDAGHVHLVCQECGRVSEIGPDAIRPLITALAERHGFETDVGHLTVFGRCADCRAGGTT